MRQILLLSVLMPFHVSAQEIEAVDSIDVETGVIYYADSTQVNDTISTDTIESVNPPIPQVPLNECDSLIARDVTDRYGVVYKDGKCGIYDLMKHENVTRIDYKELWFSFRREIEGGYYSYFGWEEDDSKGVIGVAESNNQFIAISMPKEQDMNDNETNKEE
jgi:hypothetical protein